ncbi:hypothetical protein BC939DRAFT_277050 [Gamsiella multidivaricata]|uniref:uncharacterized protein n=1 Tax=Gamsiella multidivaricata TaxID=101098 RepID=UPI002220A969|nr:uncharacterized protein BC939DRAFT_277050 [Gamsiella multidivaricata]KAI7818881.1 hypothetical protein BC939DRAFT_277050 [Gamsiella multidivaricata]
MVSDSTKKTLILSVSAIVGLTTLSTLAYLLIQDDRRAKHRRKIRALQKQLSHKLSKVESSVEALVEGDIRLAQVRTRTLRTYAIYTGDPHVHLPSLGLINPQDKLDLGSDIEETQEELIRERTQGYGEDPQKVRQGYKRLEFLVNSVNEQLLRLLESLDAISPRELTDLGDGSGGLASANGPEMQAFEKIRKRKRTDIEKIQKLMAQMDKIGASFKDRLTAVEVFEKKAEEAEEAKKAAATEEKKADMAKEAHGADVDVHVKEGFSFAEVASRNIPEPEILEPTEDLEKMKEGVTFANVASHNIEHKHHEHANGLLATTTSSTKTTTTTTTISSGSTSSISSSSSATVAVEETSHLEKVQEGISFAEVTSHNLPEEKPDSEVKTDQVLEETEDLEMMKAGITFADVVAQNTEEDNSAEKSEVLEETEDLEKMRAGITFADVVAAEETTETTTATTAATTTEIEGAVAH